MSDRYRDVAPATDAIAIPMAEAFQKSHTPGAVVVQADNGWGHISILSGGSELGVLMSRDELIQLYDLISEAERHLYRESHLAAARAEAADG